MLLHKFTPSATTASAGWSGNMPILSTGVICRQVYVKSATSSTVFDFTITDEDDIDVRTFTDITGVINDLTQTPLKGTITLAITNATADEGFTILLCFQET